MTHGLAATEQIPFGTAVTNPFTRHYTVVANAHATLAEIYPGASSSASVAATTVRRLAARR